MNVSVPVVLSRTDELVNLYENTHLGLFPVTKVDHLVTTDLDSAVSTAKSMGVEDRDRAFRKISLQFAKNGNISRAKEIADQIETARIWEGARCLIVLELARKGDFVKVEPEIRQMTGEDNKEDLYRNIATIFASRGDLYHAQRFVSSIRTPHVQNRAFQSVIEELLKRKLIKEALEVADSLLNDEKSSALKNISFEMAKSGDIVSAQTLASTITDRRTQSDAIELIDKIAEMKI